MLKKRSIGCLAVIIILCLSGCGRSMPAVESVPDAGTPVSEEIVMPTAATEAFSEEATEEASGAAAEETLSILMVGDILMHDRVEAAARQEDGSYAYDAIFTHTKDTIQAADLALVNQEVILGGEELGISGYPAFNAPFTVADALVDAGFDVVCHATNHALDKGRKGVLNCTSFWNAQYPDIAVLGLFDSQKAQDTLYVYEQNGFRIAVLNYTYGTNGIPLPDDMPYAVNLLDKECVIADIQVAEALADFTIICPHWGTEYQLEQSAVQKEWAKLFAAYGADLVLGTHPHVIQPVEWITDEATGHEMLVYYSLGNFVNWTGETGAGIANRMVGAMAQITLAKKDGEVIISEYGIEPVISHVTSGTNGVTVYRLSDYTEELAAENEILFQDAAFSKAYCEQLCEQVFKEKFIP